MISSVKGAIQSIGDKYVVIQVAGIGVQVYVPGSVTETIGREGDSVVLHTTLLIRNDVPILYGFPAPGGKRLFDLLQEVSGVGPRLALDILDAMTPDDAAVAIVSGNADLLSSVKGIGKRTAGRIVIDLQSKLQKEWEAAAVGTMGPNGEVMAALQALGYSPAEVQQAVTDLGDTEIPLEEQVRQALQRLARE